jgi:hypothetical protein
MQLAAGILVWRKGGTWFHTVGLFMLDFSCGPPGARRPTKSWNLNLEDESAIPLDEAAKPNWAIARNAGIGQTLRFLR